VALRARRQDKAIGMTQLRSAVVTPKQKTPELAYD